MNEASMTQRIALGGIQTERDNADHHLGSLRGAERRRIELEEKVVVIPIESILAINYSNEIKKGETEYKRVRLRTPPPQVQLSCCQEISKCCKTFWCCDNSKVQVHTEPEEIITTISNQEAERKVLITIEYIRYSNIDTPSHIRVLSVPDQFAFFREHLCKDTLNFYLLDSYDFEQADFDLKRMQASTLCRLVTQLKAMVGYYPDEPTLQMIIDKGDNMAIGDPPNETIGRLTGPGMITASLELTVPFQVNENRF